jgi:hypothetical protein
MTQTARERTTAKYARGALFGLAAVSIWAGNIVVAGLGLRIQPYALGYHGDPLRRGRLGPAALPDAAGTCS